MNNTTLLITGTIQPNNDLKHKSTVLYNEHFFDPKYREKEYISTILYYITNSNFDRFIFCENSGYNIKERENVERIAKFYGKQIELLQFIGDKENIIKYSYHYGEAEIFDYAFEHSKLLKETDKFFKATGRYIIHNINNLIEQYKNQDYFFYKGFWLKSTLCVNTAFFMCTNRFYKEYLYRKQIDYYKKHYKEGNRFIPLEGVFYNLLKEKLFEDKMSIKQYPIFHFFDKKDIYIEDIKKILGLLNYGNMSIFIDKIFKVLRNKQKIN